MFRLVILILMVILCSAGRKPATRKRPNTDTSNSNPALVENDDKTRSLQDWLLLPRQVLNLACNTHGLVSTGSVEVVANRLYNHFHHPNSSQPGTSIPPTQRSSPTVPTTANPATHPGQPQSVPVASIAEIVRAELAAFYNNNPISSVAVTQTQPRGQSTSVGSVRTQPGQSTSVSNNLSNDNNIRVNLQNRSSQIYNLPNNIHGQGLQTTNNLPNTNLPIQNHNNLPNRNLLQSPNSLLYLNNQMYSLPNIQNGASTVNNPIGTQNQNFAGPSSYVPAVPARILNQIMNCEYINFNSLLPSAIATSSDAVSIQVDMENNELHFSSASGGGGSASRSSPSRPKVRDIHSWLSAWNTYIRATLHYHPTLAIPMLHYQNIICRFASQYEFSAWSTYDIQFRQRLAINPLMAWDRIDEELCNEYVRSGQLRLVCFTCHRPGHLSSHCPSRSVVGSSSRPTNMNNLNNAGSTITTPVQGPPFRVPQQRTCYHYNTRGCTNQHCRFPHRCTTCNEPHPATHCPKRKYVA